MHFFIILLSAEFIFIQSLAQGIPPASLYGYIERVAIPLAKDIRRAEETRDLARIVGGTKASEHMVIPYQVGLITYFKGENGTVGICGGSLINAHRVVTAAHCWYDGVKLGHSTTAVFGSHRLFSGGTRIKTDTVVMHPKWNPTSHYNDVSVIYLPTAVKFSKMIYPIALPLKKGNFVGESCVASGYGLTNDGSNDNYNILKYVELQTISNSKCSLAYTITISDSNLCTRSARHGNGGIDGTCQGDSGGPLVVFRNKKPILVGITSFGAEHCNSTTPQVYARVTSFMDFFAQHSAN